MLADKMAKHGSNAWLVNTGWYKGKYGVGTRIPIEISRAIIDSINSGELGRVQTRTMPIFNLEVPTSCTGVPSDVLYPEEL